MSFSEQFELGVAEFNQGRFFECHDTFEELWRDARGERKIFLQGLIQSAVGLFHYLSGNTRGAHSQLTRALSKLGPYRPRYEGIEVDPLVESLERLQTVVLSALESGASSFDPDLVPRLQYRPDRGGKAGVEASRDA